MGRIVGIDLGTTYSCVAIFNERKGVYEVLPTRKGQQTLPSVVGLDPNGEVIVGSSAKNQLGTKPDITVAEIKRHMGELGPDGKPYAVQLGGKRHTPEEVSAYILRELKAAAEEALGEPVTGAVITVPAYFQEPQRQATMRAGELAGLDVKRIINEPTAAAVAYGHDQAEDDDEDEEDDDGSAPLRLFMYDLGGGTFDVSVIEVQKGNIRVKATHGNHRLGGVDFDRAIGNWVVRQIQARYGVDIEGIAEVPGKAGEPGRRALARIHTSAEAYKRDLSSQDTVLVQLPYLLPNPADGDLLNVEIELTRADFEELITDRIRETMQSVQAALDDAKLTVDEIDEVILVGGSTRIPMVRRMLKRRFGKEPQTKIHPDLCVAMGAAHEAVKYVDLSTVEDAEVRHDIEDAIENLPSVVDVTGHTLGVATADGTMAIMIPRQTPIPAMVSDEFFTVSDFQTVARIGVYQGESQAFRDNTKLREFELHELPAKPKGQVVIDVTYALDSNGVLTVTARDRITGREAEVEIKDERLLGAADGASLLPAAGTQRRSGSRPEVQPLAATAPAAPLEPPATAPPIPEKFAKYVEQAQSLMSKLDAANAARLQAALQSLFAATRTGTPAAQDDAADELAAVLFDCRL